ncbi:TPA: hypothetical protein KZI03_000604 [Listeria monocytogenes]|nr:hypothetical protein [Listeria monocytogenes]HBI2193244.1 hypothetical protein [Listeria monocytogenes]
MGEGLIVRRGGGGSGKPEGAYVWKKCDKPPQGTVHLTQITDGTTPMTVQLSSDVVDLSTITAKSLVGLTLYVTVPTTSSGIVTSSLPITSETTHTYAGNTYGISYDTTNYQLKFTDLGWPMGTWKDITLSNIQTVLDYVVSDDPTAYPDGGEHGGYWYEKFQLDPTLFGCTKYVVDTFTFSTDTPSQNLSINHSLGEVPLFYFISADKNAMGTSGTYIFICTGIADPNSNGYGIVKLLVDGVVKRGYASGSFGPCTSDVVCTPSVSHKFKAGIEYTLITMA